MKTVFITIFQGVEAKNILRTSVYRELVKRNDVRLVFFVRTPERAAYYSKEFFDSRISYEAVSYRAQQLSDRLFSFLKFHLIRTTTTDLRKRMTAELSRNWLGYWIGMAFNRVFARRIVRRLVRFFDRYFVTDRTFALFFEKYHPDLIFLEHLFDDEEIALLREAKRRRVRTIGFINSWDKLTARCMIRLLPDELLVYNDIVKREAVAQADLPPKLIQVVGIPQYDSYVHHQPTPRPEFMRRIGIDPAKRFLLYAPMGETFSGSDWDIIDLLQRWQESGEFGADVEVFVRFQPNDVLNDAELRRRPWLRYDRPGVRFSAMRGVDWDMSGQELGHLADTLHYMELLVCYASSMSVDAAVFSKPVVNINFEIKSAELLVKSPTQFYQMEHYRNALATGGIRLVQSQPELLEWVRRYLADPTLDREGRARLVRQQCGVLDGRASARIARAMLSPTGQQLSVL